MNSVDNQTVLQARDAIDGRIHGAINARMERWILGRRFPTGIALVDSLIANTNRVYVRPADESYEYRVVWGNASGANVPVWIELLPDGTWQLKSVDYAASFNIGAKVDTAFMPPLAGDALKMVLPGYSFRPGRLRIDTTGGLIAYVEPFAYVYENTEKYWEGGTVDLTAAVPGTAETWRWVKVGINPATNAITTTNGGTQSIYVPLTDVQLSAIAMSGMIACGGVKLRNGQTKIGTSEGDFADAHAHFFTPHPLLSKSNLGATTDPGTGDDSADGYAIGSKWINTTTDTVFECTDATAAAAVWKTSAGADNFLSLTDTPSSYSGQGSKVIAVTPGETALEFVTTPGLPPLIGTKYESLAPPSSPDALDDEFDNSSVAVAWTEIDHATTLTVTEDAAGLLLTAASSSGNCGLVKSIPSGDFTIDSFAHVAQIGNAASEQTFASLTLWQGTGATDDLINVILDPQGNRICVATWSQYNTFTSVPGISLVTAVTSAWLRIQRSSTTYSFWTSTTGLTWRRLHSTTLSYTPSHFGVGTLAMSSATAYARFSCFRYTPSVLNQGQSIGGQRVNLYA